MAKLKKIRLINFGGYVDTSFDFTNKPLVLLYGPNGYGKSTLVEAIRITSNPYVFLGRAMNPDVYLRKMIRDDNYDPNSDSVRTTAKRAMRVEAIYDDNGKDAEVVLTNKGFEKNDLTPIHGGHAFYTSTKNVTNWAKFQMISDDARQFIDLAEAIYGHECDLDAEVYGEIEEPDGTTSKHLFYQDFIIEKKGTKVHYGLMSDGEKKLATVLRQLCTPDNVANRDIVMIDEIDAHVYFKRHAMMIDKLMEVFPNKQIIATTHSPVLVGFGNSPPHVQPEHLYDLETIIGEAK